MAETQTSLLPRRLKAAVNTCGLDVELPRGTKRVSAPVPGGAGNPELDGIVMVSFYP